MAAMKPYSGIVTGKDGQLHSVRFLLTDEEFADLCAAGALPPNTCEVMGMQDAVNRATARFEVQAYMARGGVLQ
jgi:hypothetical protein